MRRMFADQTLTPKEAVRFCALGLIAEAPQRYAALAGGVRHFCSRIAGPQLELMGTSIELLRYEGLVQAVEGQGMEDDALLAITDVGRKTLHTLLTARLRPASDLTKLVVALKMRFLHLLEGDDRQSQIDMLVDVTESELARLEDLASSSAEEGAVFVRWLDHEIAQSRQHLAWLQQLTWPPHAAAGR
jgi:DNA-binding PadR family transcriptional regulator